MRRHIRQAGLEGRVRVHRQDLKTLTLEGPAGVFLLNPPYGERLSDREGARALYRELGLLIRRHPGWRLCALSADPGFERAFGRRADKKRRLYNGRLECDFFLYLSGGQGLTFRRLCGIINHGSCRLSGDFIRK